MWKYLVPRVLLADVPIYLFYMVLGAFIAGTYGIVHDQVTFTIGPQYFYNFKFQQFADADFGFGDRIFVGCIGFLATWWVGAIAGWILCRRLIPHRDRRTAGRDIRRGFVIIFAFAFTAGLAGYGYGLWRGPDGDYSAWQPTLTRFGITDIRGFIRVAYIHNAGYVGGAAGIVVAWFLLRPGTDQDHESHDATG